MKRQVISEEEFKKNLDKNFLFEDYPSIALCVSGGVDSVALTLLMKQWIKIKNGKLIILHFNHRIRKESLNDAKFVKKLARRMNISSFFFEWEGKIPSNGIMNEARNQRYDKFIKFCKKKKILHLMTAHHSDDNFETFVMRKKRTGTTIGLLSIPIKRISDDLVILRPLINYSKKKLIATCEHYNLDWVNDSSNSNCIFERPRIRKEISKLDSVQIKNLRNEKNKVRIKNLDIEKRVAEFFLSNLNFYNYGVFEITKSQFNKLDKEIGQEVLKKILATCSGNYFSPRSKSVNTLYTKLLKKEQKKITLHGCLIKNHNDLKISFQREILGFKGTKQKIKIKKGQNYLWDRRFKITSKNVDIHCRKIDDKVWLGLKPLFKKKRENYSIELDIIKSLPLIICEGEFLIPFLTENFYLKQKGIQIIFSPISPLTKKNFF